MKDMTLCIPLIGNDGLILARKLTGFGAGKINGFGGHVEQGETIEQATVRELVEEVTLSVEIDDLTKVAELRFIFPFSPEDDQLVHVFTVCKWKGYPTVTKEMSYEIMSIDRIPYDHMWPDDRVWLPFILRGKKVKATFGFEEDGENIDCVVLDTVEKFDENF